MPEVCSDGASVPWWEDDFDEVRCTDADLIDLPKCEDRVLVIANREGIVKSNVNDERGKIPKNDCPHVPVGTPVRVVESTHEKSLAYWS